MDDKRIEEIRNYSEGGVYANCAGLNQAIITECLNHIEKQQMEINELNRKVLNRIIDGNISACCEECEHSKTYGAIGDRYCRILGEYFTGNVKPPYKEAPDECPMKVIDELKQRIADCDPPCDQTKPESKSRYPHDMDGCGLKPDVTVTDVGNIAEPKRGGHGGCRHSESGTCDQCNECGNIEEPGNEKTDEHVCENPCDKNGTDKCPESSDCRMLAIHECDDCDWLSQKICEVIEQRDEYMNENERLKASNNRYKKALSKSYKKVRNQRKELALLNRKIRKFIEDNKRWYTKCKTYEDAIKTNAVGACGMCVHSSVDVKDSPCVDCLVEHNDVFKEKRANFEFDSELFSGKGGDE